ncbi:hypothetical protein ALC62_15592 [Cyphomyrmex costatus]|uniref:DUF5641 domain-containing protein n=1 Tax=Cyphomyrmex costatus TaxID=456900 RepID=A0A151I712_9HYME|nr:hypothetical protein ALC62_15592 [Cyphomyrmex costatus]
MEINPDYNLTDLKLSRLSRWQQLVQRLLQDFWKWWATEYLSNLQGRTKWKGEQLNLMADDLVVLHDENLLPLKWRLGRVVEVHTGQDGLIRIVSVRTANGIFKRAVAKLCKLPTPSQEKEIRAPNLVGGMLETDRDCDRDSVNKLPAVRSADVTDSSSKAPRARTTLTMIRVL